ncbi:MAG: polymerase subunit sigma-24 [Proteobacteria bacterium]|nr:polymerase subunit sigma-24 [Pseudomonadota bacterium]
MRDTNLFDEHIPRLRRYARALTNDRSQADDLVQECLARAWEEALDAPRRATQEDGLGLRDLQAALNRLPLEQREVLLLVGLEEMSYAEVAKTLGIPIGTVMSRLSRAREHLRVQLNGAGPALRRVK